MPPTMVARSLRAIRDFRAEHGDIIVKPLYGNGGAGVFRLPEADSNLAALHELFSQISREPMMVQKFVPDVAKGDKRIILVDGEPVGAINRVPQAGETRSNMHVGGRAEKSEMTERDLEICARLGPKLRERGLVFTGIDVIGRWLTEINVTSPTGIQELERFDGVNAAALIWDAIERRRGALTPMGLRLGLAQPLAAAGRQAGARADEASPPRCAGSSSASAGAVLRAARGLAFRRRADPPAATTRRDGAIEAEWASRGRPDRRKVILYLHGGAYLAGSIRDAPPPRRGAGGRGGRAAAAAGVPAGAGAPLSGGARRCVGRLRAPAGGRLWRGRRSRWRAIRRAAGWSSRCCCGWPPRGCRCRACAVGFSPWVDMTGRQPSLRRNAQRDVLLPAGRMPEVVALSIWASTTRRTRWPRRSSATGATRRRRWSWRAGARS